jgi:pimeloyl-ACP methyl ester carboxylesterase
VSAIETAPVRPSGFRLAVAAVAATALLTPTLLAGNATAAVRSSSPSAGAVAGRSAPGAGTIHSARKLTLPTRTTSRVVSVKPDRTVTTTQVAAAAVPTQAWRILYGSTTARGQATTVSGTVIVPTAAYSGTRPLVAYAPGTQGWGDDCAPSASIAAGNFDEQFAVDNLLNKGWAVVVTDYPGLGTPGQESYNVGIAEGYAVLDSLRAALKLPAAGLSPNAPLGIEGYSQGGAAGGWAAQQLSSYAPELRVAGIAAGGTPADLQAVSNNINGTIFFAFLAGTAIGFDAEYPSLNLAGSLTAAGKAAVADLSTLCQIPALLKYANKRVQDYTIGGTNPIETPPWQQALTANNLGRTRPTVPVLLYHGWLDEVIPWKVASTLHSQWCSAGANNQLQGYLAEHVLTQVTAQSNVVAWLGDRIAGKAAPKGC